MVSLFYSTKHTSNISLSLSRFLLLFSYILFFHRNRYHHHQLNPHNMVKSRNKLRQSSTSYASTITTLVFILLCALGLWVITSNSIVQPATTIRKTRVQVSDDSQQQRNKGSDEKFTSLYQDNPRDQTEDVLLKSDEPKENNIEKLKLPEDQKAEAEIVDTANEESDNDIYKTGDDAGNQASEESAAYQRIENQILQESNVTPKQEENHQESKNEESDDKLQNSQEEIEQESKNEERDDKLQSSQEESQQESKNEEKDDKLQSSQEESQQESKNEENGDAFQTSQKEIQQESKNEGNEDNIQTSDETQNQILNDDQQQENENSQSSVQNDQVQDHQHTQTQISSIENQEQSEEEKSVDMDSSQQTQHEQNDGSSLNNEPQETAQIENEEIKTNSIEESREDQVTESDSGGSFPGGGASGIPKESNESTKSWSTQASESENQKERRKDDSDIQDSTDKYMWQLCNVTAGTDYIPCLDNEKALKQLHATKHFEHRERHCPVPGPTCLVPQPENYKSPIRWPQSRDKIWYHNVPHIKLAQVKGHQNWVKLTGEFLIFPGGGTQFIHGALHYIDFLQQSVPKIAWGKHTRVILDVGCGVGSFGGYLFERDVITMSFAPKDEHEAQTQFALERGIPAISAVMGSKRLPFPSRVFDLVHCARCRVPWHAEGGMLLLELNRVLRPGGYFVWSATPVYQKLPEDVEIWTAMSSLTSSMCWELVTIKRDTLNSVGAAIYRKPSTNQCYDQRKHKSPPLCKNDDDPNASWYVPMQACMHRVPVEDNVRGTRWPENWPLRVQTPPYWLNSSQIGIYGKPTPQDFTTDYEHWKQVVSKLYMNEMGISWSNVRNIMDMRAVYGGFASALKDLRVWVFNVVNVDSPDTLPIIYERGLFGIYHDWCESFSTYPRTYDLLHADHLFSRLKKRCELAPVIAEVDRIVRPGGKIIVRDESDTVSEVEKFLKSMHWEVHLTFSKNKEAILSAQKGNWRPETYEASS